MEIDNIDKFHPNYLLAKPKIIFIGGSDNIGGAGVLADLKAAEYFNCYGSAVFTCQTAQDFNSVYEFDINHSGFVQSQLQALYKSKLSYD